MKRVLAELPQLPQLRRQLGIPGMASLFALSASLAFFFVAVQPLEERSAALDRQLERAARPATDARYLRVNAISPDVRLEAFYRYFERGQRSDAWLAKIYGIASASGLELRAGEYRLADSRRRLDRYEITLPVAGSYTQIRGFLERALEEIPVLSLDRVSFHRKGSNDARIEADIALTLYLLKK